MVQKCIFVFTVHSDVGNKLHRRHDEAAFSGERHVNQTTCTVTQEVSYLLNTLVSVSVSLYCRENIPSCSKNFFLLPYLLCKFLLILSGPSADLRAFSILTVVSMLQ